MLRHCGGQGVPMVRQTYDTGHLMALQKQSTHQLESSYISGKERPKLNITTASTAKMDSLLAHHVDILNAKQLAKEFRREELDRTVLGIIHKIYEEKLVIRGKQWKPEGPTKITWRKDLSKSIFASSTRVR